MWVCLYAHIYMHVDTEISVSVFTHPLLTYRCHAKGLILLVIFSPLYQVLPTNILLREFRHPSRTKAEQLDITSEKASQEGLLSFLICETDVILGAHLLLLY